MIHSLIFVALFVERIVKNLYFVYIKDGLSCKTCKRKRRRQRQAYSKPSQTSKMEHFLKIVNGFQPLTVLSKKTEYLNTES